MVLEGGKRYRKRKKPRDRKEGGVNSLSGFRQRKKNHRGSSGFILSEGKGGEEETDKKTLKGREKWGPPKKISPLQKGRESPPTSILSVREEEGGGSYFDVLSRKKKRAVRPPDRALPSYRKADYLQKGETSATVVHSGGPFRIVSI